MLILFLTTCGSGWLRCCRPAPERRRRHPGRLRVPDRTALAGVLYVLRTGVAWRDVPAERWAVLG
ncbi:transposase [Streptomyces spiralis]